MNLSIVVRPSSVLRSRHATSLLPPAHRYKRGIPVTPDDARWLADVLYQDAYPDAVSAALAIERGVERELYAVALTTGERTAILGVLDDPPDRELCELRGQLLPDHRG